MALGVRSKQSERPQSPGDCPRMVATACEAKPGMQGEHAIGGRYGVEESVRQHSATRVPLIDVDAACALARGLSGVLTRFFFSTKGGEREWEWML